MRLPERRNGPPLVMGILNVTPDSFSDGGRWNSVDAAVEHALDMAEQGADVIDIGAESTRPGCKPVPMEEEWARLRPVLESLIGSIDVPISVDTMKPAVADRCISAGVDVINDVNGLRSEGMAEICAAADVEVVISHMYGTYETMHDSYMGDGYRSEIKAFLDAQCRAAVDAGIDDRRIIVDPGLGFGKTPEQNLSIVKDCSFLGDSHRILIGASRKRFVRTYYPDIDIDEASARISKMAADTCVYMIRAHDVARTVAALRT